MGSSRVPNLHVSNMELEQIKDESEKQQAHVGLLSACLHDATEQRG
jgi:hypothetical protein